MERMRAEIDKQLIEEQVGFRCEHPTLNLIASPQNDYRTVTWNRCLYTIFIDFEKAFDCHIMETTTSWDTRQDHQTLAHEPSACQVVHGGCLTDHFSILGYAKGVFYHLFCFLLQQNGL